MLSPADFTQSPRHPQVFHGDSREVLKTFPDAVFDSVVCDPPYALVSIVKRFGSPTAAPAKGNDAYTRASAGFMSQTWDTGETAFAVEFWAQVFRVLKPGGHVIAFSGTRTYHRLACAVEDAGFEIRDMVAWLYGSGFPKSHDVSKGIDKRRDDASDVDVVRTWLEAARKSAGVSRKDINEAMGLASNGGGLASTWTTNGTTKAVPQWEQWLQLKSLLSLPDDMDAEVWRLNGRKGTPGEAWADAEVLAIDERMNEPSGIVGIGRERTPVSREIKAANSDAARQWQGWGTALKPALEPVVLARKPLIGTVAANVLQHGTGALNIDASRIGTDERFNPSASSNEIYGQFRGEEENGRATVGRWPANVIHDGSEEVVGAFPETASNGDNGGLRSAARGDVYGEPVGGQERVSRQDYGSAARFFYSAKADAEDRLGSRHPTVKPVDLMAYLVRLVTPPGGLTLDPFAGSGTTGVGAMREGMRCVLIEREEAYVDDIVRKLAWARGEGRLTALEVAKLDTPERQAAAAGADLPLFG